jgi:hypothetical protein
MCSDADPGTAQLDPVRVTESAARSRLVTLLHEWVHHDGNHLRQALVNVQAYKWPHMGNARRFTTG